MSQPRSSKRGTPPGGCRISGNAVAPERGLATGAVANPAVPRPAARVSLAHRKPDVLCQASRRLAGPAAGLADGGLPSRRPVSSMKGRVVSSVRSMVFDFRSGRLVAVRHGSPWLIGVLGLCPGLVAQLPRRARPGQAPYVRAWVDRRRLWALDAGELVWQGGGSGWWSWCSGGWAPLRFRRCGLGGGSSHPSGRAGRTRVSCGARGLNQVRGRPARVE